MTKTNAPSTESSSVPRRSNSLREAVRTFTFGKRAARYRRWGALVPSVGALESCSSDSAPAIILFGAYFPNWLVLAIAAVVIAIIARIAFGIAGRADAVPYPLFTCLAIGILVSSSLDLFWLDR